jgi:hypothetical protein
MTDDEIQSFVRAFEDSSLPKSEWTHSRHLVMALWYIRREGLKRATVLIREGIQRYNRAQNNPNGYHETITLAWVAVIDKFLRAQDADAALGVLAEKLLEQCGDKNYLLQYYSRERLFSDEARRQGVTPDLAAII